jgi:hypothetical protein
MGFVSITTAIAVGLFIALLAIWQKKRQITRAKQYRLSYIQLLAKLDQITTQLTIQGGFAKEISDNVVLDYYESTLRIFETLLEAIKHLPPFATEGNLLSSAYFLARECSERAAKIEQAFLEFRSGKEVSPELFTSSSTTPTRATSMGCYFCSRPFVADKFSQVRVRVENEVKQVTACKVCKEELETTKKIKVLYFMKEGKPVHWSEVSDYTPAEDFWNINERKPVRKVRHLELVSTSPNPQKIGSSDQESPPL